MSSVWKARLKFLKMLFQHKRLVFKFGLKTKAPLWQLITHDMSKLSPHEFDHYAQTIFGNGHDPLKFAYAWNHHSKTNRHHWEYWIQVNYHSKSTYPKGVPLPMPENYVREMIADWLAASTGNLKRPPLSLESWDWHTHNRPLIRVHTDTDALITKILNEYFQGLRQ